MADSPRSGLIDYVIIALTVVTALIHFIVLPGDILFTLNGLGYLILVAALYLPLAVLRPYRSAVRWVLIGYTVLTVVLWIFIGARTPIAFLDKSIEVVLIILLYLNSQRQLQD